MASRPLLFLKRPIFGLLFLCFIVTPSLAQHFDWALSIGGIGVEVGRDVCTDNDGNVILVGSFSGSAQIGNVFLSGMGEMDAFVAKFTSNGDLLWARVITGPHEDLARGVVTDPDNNVYVVGHYTDTAVFVLTATDTVAVSGDGGKDLFIAKYDADGAFQWFVKGGGSGEDTGTDIDWYQYDGKLVVSGGFEDRGAFGSQLLLSHGLSDAFVLKVDQNGNVHWVRRGGGNGHDVAAAVSVNPGNGDVYIVGDYYVEADFNDVEINAVGSSDMFLVKYDQWGEFQWVRSNGGTAVDVATDVGTDHNGNVYVAGYYQGTTTFQNFTATAWDYNDVFLSKFDGDGNCQWLSSAGSYRLDNCMSMAVAWDGTSYLTGFFDELMVIEGDSIIGDGYDIFILNYSPSGDYRYGRAAGAGSSDFGMATCLGPNQSLYVAGYYFFFADFDQTTIGNADNGDAFLARMTDILGVQETIRPFQHDCFRYDSQQKMIYSFCNLNRWKISNAMGQRIMQGDALISDLDLNPLDPGFYILSYDQDGIKDSMPFVIN